MSDNPAARIPEFLSRRICAGELSDYLGGETTSPLHFLVVVVVNASLVRVE